MVNTSLHYITTFIGNKSASKVEMSLRCVTLSLYNLETLQKNKIKYVQISNTYMNTNTKSLANDHELMI